MGESSGMSTEEMQIWVERRLDKAAEEIGYAMGMMVVSLLSTMPTPEDTEAHLRAIPGLPRLTDALEARAARIAADGFMAAVGSLIPLVHPQPVTGLTVGNAALQDDLRAPT